jgi:hypothetical protein
MTRTRHTPPTMASIGIWRGLPTTVGGKRLALLPLLARQCLKRAVQPWLTKSGGEPGCRGELWPLHVRMPPRLLPHHHARPSGQWQTGHIRGTGEYALFFFAYAQEYRF